MPLFSKHFLFSLLIFSQSIISKNTIETLFGEIDLDSLESILVDALNHPTLLRMENIDQGGPNVYFGLAPSFTRKEHMIGTLALLRKHEAPINEQLAATLHDVSHTAFSHLGDMFYQGNHSENAHSYQDTIHLTYLKKNGVEENICKKHGIKIELLDPDREEYSMLEASLPKMCGDRIEYNLHTGVKYNLLNLDDVKYIESHLHFGLKSYLKDGKIITEKIWYFNDVCAAKKFALLPLYFIKHIWNATFNFVMYKFFVTLIKYAIKEGLLTEDTFKFGTDIDIMNILKKSKDPYIIYMLDCVTNIFDTFEIVYDSNGEYDEFFKGKFRGIDPYVENKDGLKLLTELDPNFKLAYNTSAEECKQGVKIKLKKPYKYEDYLKLNNNKNK